MRPPDHLKAVTWLWFQILLRFPRSGQTMLNSIPLQGHRPRSVHDRIGHEREPLPQVPSTCPPIPLMFRIITNKLTHTQQSYVQLFTRTTRNHTEKLVMCRKYAEDGTRPKHSNPPELPDFLPFWKSVLAISFRRTLVPLRACTCGAPPCVFPRLLYGQISSCCHVATIWIRSFPIHPFSFLSFPQVPFLLRTLAKVQHILLHLATARQ